MRNKCKWDTKVNDECCLVWIFLSRKIKSFDLSFFLETRGGGGSLFDLSVVRIFLVRLSHVK